MGDESLMTIAAIVARLEERGDAMEKRITIQAESFQKELKAVTESLKETAKTINTLKSILIIVVMAILASGANITIDLEKLIKLMGAN